MLLSCANPSFVWIVRKRRHPVDGWYQRIEVPCRKCALCRKKRALEWSWRMRTELVNDTGVFLTLTYSDSQVPTVVHDLFPDERRMTLRKTDVQKFMKRLRKHFGDLKLKYYCAGEYGEQTRRPHYHFAIFGLPLERLNVVNNVSCVVGKLWSYGLNDCHVLTPAACMYVANYLSKASFLDFFCTGCERPFALMSKGLGVEWLNAQKDRLLKNGFELTSSDGSPVPLSQYYLRKIRADLDDTQLDELDKRLTIKSEKAYDRLLYQHKNLTRDKIKALRKEANANLKAKNNMRKRDPKAKERL